MADPGHLPASHHFSPIVELSAPVFSSKSALHIRWPKYKSFSFSISPSNEYSGLIPFRIDWFDLAVQETLKNLLQHHSSKASILQCSVFFMVQLSHPYMTIALTIQTFVQKVISLLFNMLSRFVIAFPSRTKHLLISWLQSLSTLILGPKKISLSLFPCFLHLFAIKRWDQMPFSSFFECWVLSQLFPSPFSPSSRSSLVPLCFLPLEWCHSCIRDYWYFSQQSWFQLVSHPTQHFIWCTWHVC